MLNRLSAAAFLAAATFVALPALAAEPGEGIATTDLNKLLDAGPGGSALGGWADRYAERRQTFPWVEHHGYFRFRADFFHNGHLGTVVPGEAGSGSSNIPAPLTENAVNNADETTAGQVGSEDAKVIATANMRLRYSPTVHISDSLRIHTTVDILDNLVLGSTPDYGFARSDVPLSVLSQAQAPPSAGVNGVSDSIRIKEAYGEFQPSFLLRLGRQTADWGLGILANDGSDYDDDYGDYTDRALLRFSLYGVYVTAAWDYVYSGAVTDDPTQNFGQAKDLGGADDVQQWTLSFSQQPMSERELIEREKSLREDFKPAFDWGVYGRIRQQDFDLSDTSLAAIQSEGGAAAYDSLSLVPRNAFAVIGDLWLRYEQRFDFHSGIRLELEAVGIFGEIENTTLDSSLPETAVDLEQIGLAFEAQYDSDTLTIGLDAGFATGGTTRGSTFSFDPDYHLDLIMFREVLGTVANAWYAKPYVSFDFFQSRQDRLGFQVDLLLAGALDSDATPGKSSFYGFEGDVALFFHDKAGFRFDLEMGFLFPGAALNYRPVEVTNERDASFAFTLQSRLTMHF